MNLVRSKRSKHVKKHNLSALFFSKLKSEFDFTMEGFHRGVHHFSDSCSVLVDTHSRHDARICYLNIASEQSSEQLIISSVGTTKHSVAVSQVGTVLRVSCRENLYTVWLPLVCSQTFFDDNRRIYTSTGSEFQLRWEFQPQLELQVLTPGVPGKTAVMPFMITEDADGRVFDELVTLSEVECRSYRKSNWFFSNTPTDLWNYLINGSIYDPRSHPQINKRFICQQCAYSWWSYFEFLYNNTGKKVYVLLRDEIAYSVLLDMTPLGEWGHGFWSDVIETHSRFHLDGLHLLISQYEKTGEGKWLEAAERGMSFMHRHLTEQLDEDKVWFLHDTIENAGNHHFESHIFGKTLGNSLCLNTHIQTLTVLNRLLQLLPDKKTYAEISEKGCTALRTVLAHQPAEFLYKPLMFWIFKYKSRQKLPSMAARLRTSLENRILPRVYWTLQRRFPRLVQPNGFIERDLTLSFVSDRYHITNIKDFLTLYQLNPIPWLRSYIKNGFQFIREFVRRCGLINALHSSPYFIELIDIYYMYDKLIETLPADEKDAVQEKIYEYTNGHSLDLYASSLVRGPTERDAAVIQTRYDTGD